MRIVRVRVSGFKGLRVEFRWASPIVLFGKNDAGKTNILEAVAESLSSAAESRGGRTLGRRECEFEALVELDDRDVPGSLDNRLFRSLLHFRDAPPVFLDPELERMREWHWELNDDEWREEEVARARTVVGGEPLPLDVSGEPLDLPTAIREMRRRKRFDLPASELDRCLGSRWLRVLVGSDSECFVDWIVPDQDGQAQFPTRSGDVLMDLTPWAKWVKFRPFDVVELHSDASNVEAFYERAQRFVERSLIPGRPDLVEEVVNGLAVNALAVAACSEVSEIATSIAPRFIRDRYRIVVRPFVWRELARSGRTVSITLESYDGEEAFDLRIVGSGLALWTGIVLQEAIRLYEADTDDGPQGMAGGPSAWLQDSRWWGTRRSGRPLLYLVDEPERHLHPAAQAEAAAWISERLSGGGNQILLSTHSLPFLDVGAATYLLVSRRAEGVTSVQDISADPLGYLDVLSEEAGLANRAQLLQLTRAVLLVEGEHDKLVLRHFYGSHLDSHRIRAIPIRGAMKVSALIDAELLRGLDVPLIVLFDNVDGSLLYGDEKPPGAHREARELWQALQAWPTDEPRPRIVTFRLPDIVCALPETCVSQVLATDHGRRGFQGWDEIILRFTEAGEHDFKRFFARSFELADSYVRDEFVARVLEVCRVSPPPGSPLADALAQVMEWAVPDAPKLPD